MREVWYCCESACSRAVLNKPEALGTAPELCHAPVHIIHRCCAHSQQAVLIRHLHADEVTLHSVCSQVQCIWNCTLQPSMDISSRPSQGSCAARTGFYINISLLQLSPCWFSLPSHCFIACSLSSSVPFLPVPWHGREGAMYTSSPEPPLLFCTAFITL